MGSKRMKPSNGSLSKTNNKLRRQELFIQQKKDKDSQKRDVRFRRRREEEKDPNLRRDRLAKNVPHTIDRKRVWDKINEGDDEGTLGLSAPVEEILKIKKQRLEESEAAELDEKADEEDDEEDDGDSMLDPSSDEEEDEDDAATSKRRQRAPSNAPSLAASTTSTNLDLTPSSLALKFPTLFTSEPPPMPKILVTTSINSSLHAEAEILTSFFPNSVYIRRTIHRFGHKYSLREISKFAANRNFTAVVLLKEDRKVPVGLTIVHIGRADSSDQPTLGPTLTFSIANWVTGKAIPGHGNPTNHYPELILNNFHTSLGLLTARMFLALMPPKPEFIGRQVVTLHNQRDYIFVRRHRYIFRQRRTTEKSVVDSQGKEIKGVEDIRAGLQEIGPRFTLKLRRVDKGVGRAGSEGEDALQWEWKPGMEKVRTRFNL